tara:strand:- start:808 stop:1014 length:207 start_codon:yes stop_codon:yes gene_type:complete
MKALFIYFILINGDLIKEEVHEGSCGNYFKEKVQVIEQKKFFTNQSLTIHKYKGFTVVGYTCTDKEVT